MPAALILAMAEAGMAAVDPSAAIHGAKVMFVGMSGSTIVQESPITPVIVPCVVDWSWMLVFPASVLASIDWI